MPRDFETLYYEQQAEHTEARGMLAQERDHWKKKADELDAECERLTNCLAKAETDAARYRWLRSHDWDQEVCAALYESTCGTQFDAMTDAAMQRPADKLPETSK